LKKFERISKNRVSSPLRGSLLQRGAPTRRASEKVGSTDNLLKRNCLKEKRKNFKELLLNSNGRPGCSQFLAVLPETAIKNRKEYN
jgi:hypothetical protein